MTENINDISADEIILFEGKPNFSSGKAGFVTQQCFVAFLIILFSLLFSFCITKSFSIEAIIVPLIIGSCLFFFIWQASYKYFVQNSLTSNFKITNKRIIIVDNVKYVDTKILFNQIRGFYVVQDFWDKKFNCADIKINTEIGSYWVYNVNRFRTFYKIIKENTAAFVEPFIVDGKSIKQKVQSNEKIIWEGGTSKIASTFQEIFKIFLFFFIFSSVLFFMNEKIDIFFFGIFFIFIALLYFLSMIPYLKDYKKIYYIITNKRILYCNRETEGVCRIIPLEKIDDCYVFYKKKNDPKLRIISGENLYEIYDFGNLEKTKKLINKWVERRKYILFKEKNNAQNI